MKRSLVLRPLVAMTLLLCRTAGAHPLDDLAPGEWVEVPGTQMQDVVPDPAPTGLPSNVMAAWSGGALDTTRNRLLVMGGGHGDYGGNEVYAFDIATLTWSVVWGPSPLDQIEAQFGQACTPTYPDGNPVSRHTYDGLSYLPVQDAFWLHAGSQYCGSGGMALDLWWLDLKAPSWTEKTTRPDSQPTVVYSAWDPVTGHVFVQAYTYFYEYAPETDTWTRRGTYGPGLGLEGAAAIDPIHRKFVLLGEERLLMYDLDGASTQEPEEPTTTGDLTLLAARYQALEWDARSERLVGWDGGGSVYSLDLGTYTWTRHDPVGTTLPTEPQGAGTFGRWAYVEAYNAFLLVNAIDENVYFYRLSEGAGPGPTDMTPPAAPLHLRVI